MTTNSDQLAASDNVGRWRTQWLVVTALMVAWLVGWLIAIYFVAGGLEFGSDAPTFDGYIDNPSMLLVEVPREFFGASVAAPLMPFEIAGSAALFQPFWP